MGNTWFIGSSNVIIIFRMFILVIIAEIDKYVIVIIGLLSIYVWTIVYLVINLRMNEAQFRVDYTRNVCSIPLSFYLTLIKYVHTPMQINSSRLLSRKMITKIMLHTYIYSLFMII